MLKFKNLDQVAKLHSADKAYVTNDMMEAIYNATIQYSIAVLIPSRIATDKHTTDLWLQ